MRHFSNGHGDGQIFSFDMKDNSGEITVISFNLAATSIEPRIKKNLVSFDCQIYMNYKCYWFHVLLKRNLIVK
jgi:hypothetical protein